MNKQTSIKNSTIIINISLITIVFITSLFLGVLINLINGTISIRFFNIALINSIFLSIGSFFNFFIIRHILPKVNNFLLFIFSFLLSLGISISDFFIVFLFDPFFFLYETKTIKLYLIINFLFVSALTVIMNGLMIHQKILDIKEKEISEEKNLRRHAEQKLYASQLNPHFLFNTLNLIISLLKKNPEAEKALILLSELLRYNLDASEKEYISICEELENVSKYLSIQKLRFENRLDYKINCMINHLIPPLILQPLVENSIKHNINNTEKLIIEVIVEKVKNLIVIKIYDNLRILKNEMIGKGTGLNITKKRVELYGGKFIIENGGIEIRL